MKIYFLLAIGFLSIFGYAQSQYCDWDEFECDNGLCIPEGWSCDGEDDCGDMSDEPEICFGCRQGFFKCANGKCALGSLICDGENGCGDMSDEIDPETGTCPLCPAFLFQCQNGRCAQRSAVCDGRDDCGDMSDEPEICPACRDAFFQCADGRCVPGVRVCDGNNDCGDMSDEIDPETGTCPQCPVFLFQCQNGRCVQKSVVCNGRNNCFDWSDESEEECPCAEGEFRCGTPPSDEPGPPGACIPQELVCDEEGIWDCRDGSDEANCTLNSAPKVTRNRSRSRQRNRIHHPLRKSVKTNLGKMKPHLWNKIVKKYSKKGKKIQ